MPSFEMITPVTDAHLAEAREGLGREVRFEGWNREATWDTIRHYAWGIGDDNPLWCDPEYARTTRYGDLIAPPTFLYSICDAACAPGLVGLQPVYAGAKWDFYLPVRRGDALTFRAVYSDADEVTGKVGGRMILQWCDVDYFNQGGEKVGHVRSGTWRLARAGAEGGLKYEPRARHVYTPEEWQAVEAGVRGEVRRGAEPRYYEDVGVGEEITPVVKGPIDRIAMTAYYAGVVGTSGYKGVELRWKNWILAREQPETLPDNYDVSYFREIVSPSAGHQDDDVARDIGMPGAYDNGPQRLGWMAHLVTNWAGDHGWLRHLDVQVRRPNLFGDTTWCRGRVVDKRVAEDGDHLVQLDLWAENQLGQRNTVGSALVQLPSHSA